MSKKTRKKSSKPAPKSRKTPARKPPVAKSAQQVCRHSGQKACRQDGCQDRQQARQIRRQGGCQQAGQSGQNRPHPIVAQADIEKVNKIQPFACARTGSGNRTGRGCQGAPAFSLPRDGGGNVSLADYAGKKLVLFFYPRADTPGCTREAIDFTRLESAFADAGAAVLGVSADTVKAQESFSAKHQLSVPLISDEQHEMLEAYGAWGEKSMYGRNFMGIIRTTVLIGADGRIAKIWRNVRVDGHAEEVLAAVRAI